MDYTRYKDGGLLFLFRNLSWFLKFKHFVRGRTITPSNISHSDSRQWKPHFTTDLLVGACWKRSWTEQIIIRKIRHVIVIKTLQSRQLRSFPTSACFHTPYSQMRMKSHWYTCTPHHHGICWQMIPKRTHWYCWQWLHRCVLWRCQCLVHISGIYSCTRTRGLFSIAIS